MTRRPLALTLSAILLLSVSMSACDRLSPHTEQEHIQRAKDFEDSGDTRSSIIELKNALQKNPQSAQARLLLGQIYLKSGMGAEAEKELSRAEKLGVSAETIKPLRGEALLLTGDYKRLLDEITPVDSTSPARLARILQLRGDALFRMGDLQRACALQKQSYETDPGRVATHWSLAQCAVAERDMAQAKKWLDAALKINDQQAKTQVFLGDWQRLNGHTEAALTAYAEALKSDPENLEALQNRAILNVALNRLAAAKTDVAKVESLAPSSAGALYLQALLSFHEKKYPETREALQNAFKISPDNMPAVLLAGVNAYVLGSYHQAETYLQRFLSAYPGHSYARRALAATLIKQEQYDRALDALAPNLTPGTRDVQALALAGDAYLLKGESARAAQFFERAAAIDPKNAAVHTQLGLSQLATGNGHLAVSALEVAASLDTTRTQADSLLVLSYLERKQYDKALEAIAVMEKKQPKSPIPHGLRGDAYVGKGDLANARKSFERALALDPAFFPAADRLAQLDLRDKKPAMARKRFEAVLARNKNDLQAMLALAQLAAINHNMRESVSWLEKATSAHPKALRPRQLLVTYLLGQKQSQKALSYAREAVDANPDNAEALDLLGTAQDAAGERQNALSTYARLTEKFPKSANAFYKLGLLQDQSGDPEGARSSLKKALNIDPGYRFALDALLELEVKAGNIEAALQVARNSQSQQPKSPLGLTREGDVLSGAKRYAEAVRAYEKATQLGMDTPLAIKLHRARTLAGQTAQADGDMREWLRAHPDDFTALSYLAQSQMHAGRIADATTNYEAAHRLAPRDLATLNNLALLYHQQGDARALATAEQANKIGGQNPAVMDTLGWILVSRGQTARGLPLLQKAAASAPREPSIRYHLAVALANAGRTAAARQELQQALSARGAFPERDAAAALSAKLGR